MYNNIINKIILDRDNSLQYYIRTRLLYVAGCIIVFNCDFFADEVYNIIIQINHQPVDL
jgi:hypothetical protein